MGNDNVPNIVSLSHCLEQLYSCIFNSYLKETHVKVFLLFTSCRPVYWCVRDDSQLCIVCVHSLITRLQLKEMSIMYESAHDAITFQLLNMSSITTPNQKPFSKISAILRSCIMERNQSGSNM